MVHSLVLLSAIALCLGSAEAHMSIWTRSMFGVGWLANGAQMDFQYIGELPVATLFFEDFLSRAGSLPKIYRQNRTDVMSYQQLETR